MAIIDKSGILEGNLIEAQHLLRIYESLDGTGSYSVVATGSFTGSFAGDGSQLTGISSSNSVTASYAETASFLLGSIASASYSDTAVSASFATSSSQAVSASFATTALTASFVPGAILQNGNSFGTTITIGTDDAFDFQFQVSGSTAARIEGNSATNRGQLRIVSSGSFVSSTYYPALAIGNSLINGIIYGDGQDTGSNDGLGLIDAGNECASFAQASSGINGSPIAVIGQREFFKANDKWGGAGVHVQNGYVAADGYLSNMFFSGLYSAWIKKTTNAGFWLDTSSPTEGLNFWSAPTSSVTGSDSIGTPLSVFMTVDTNYSSSTIQPNIAITNRLSIGTLWGGTGVAFYRDATSGEIRATTSDSRLKTNVNAITGSLSIVNSLQGVYFDWTNRIDPEFDIDNAATGSQIGLIAQEVQKVLPNVVKPSGYKDYLTVEYDKIVAVLIEAVKEQQQQILDLQEAVKALQTP